MLSYVTDRGGWVLKQVNGGGEQSDYSDYSREVGAFKHFGVHTASSSSGLENRAAVWRAGF